MASFASEGGAARQPISISAIVDMKASRPSATSRGRGWNGATVDVYGRRSNCAGHFAPLDHHTIAYCPSGSARLVQRRDGIVHEGLMSAGKFLLIPAGVESAWDGDAATSVRLRIPAPLVAEAASQTGHGAVADPAIRNVFEARDTLVEHLALVLLSELDRKPHPAQALMAEHISMALAVHLLRRYGTNPDPRVRDLPRLDSNELGLVTAFIEDNLDATIRLTDLAEVVRVSRFHFARMFKQSTGLTATAFVERCRMERARSLIAETGIPLAEIAVMTGFADQSHFTRRFHRHAGCTPAAYAREKGRRTRGQRDERRERTGAVASTAEPDERADDGS